MSRLWKKTIRGKLSRFDQQSSKKDSIVCVVVRDVCVCVGVYTHKCIETWIVPNEQNSPTRDGWRMRKWMEMKGEWMTHPQLQKRREMKKQILSFFQIKSRGVRQKASIGFAAEPVKEERMRSRLRHSHLHTPTHSYTRLHTPTSTNSENQWVTIEWKSCFAAGEEIKKVMNRKVEQDQGHNGNNCSSLTGDDEEEAESNRRIRHRKKTHTHTVVWFRRKKSRWI